MAQGQSENTFAGETRPLRYFGDGPTRLIKSEPRNGFINGSDAQKRNVITALARALFKIDKG
jgi:hypothetical protein